MFSRRQKDCTVPRGKSSAWDIFLYPMPAPRISFMDCFWLSKNYYDHYDANNTAFDDFLVYEEEVTTEKAMIAGNDAKVIRTLKALKSAPQFVEEQEVKIAKMISLWENGEIPAKVSKDVVKKINNPPADIVELYYAILNLVPPIYFEPKKKATARVDGNKQVILSCFLKGE